MLHNEQPLKSPGLIQITFFLTHWPVMSSCASASGCGLNSIPLFVSICLGPQLKLQQLPQGCYSQGSRQEHIRTTQNYILAHLKSRMEHMLCPMAKVNHVARPTVHGIRTYIPTTVSHSKGGEERKDSKQTIQSITTVCVHDRL